MSHYSGTFFKTDLDFDRDVGVSVGVGISVGFSIDIDVFNDIYSTAAIGVSPDVGCRRWHQRWFGVGTGVVSVIVFASPGIIVYGCGFST